MAAWKQDYNHIRPHFAHGGKTPAEFAHLVAINPAISEGILGNTVVVYRPHPWGGGRNNGGRILDRSWRHVRIESTMREYLEAVRGGKAVISLPDYRDTHDVLFFVDALVSPFSMILLEGALHGKPILCFPPGDEADVRHFQLAVTLALF